MEKTNDNNKSHCHNLFLRKCAGRLYWLFLLLVILAAAAIRIRLLDVPLERDEGEYAYAAQLMLQGMPPYSHVYNMKMPGIYAAYALILLAFGQTHVGIHLGLLVINAITTVLIFLLAKYLMDSWMGIFAAAAFAVMSLTLPVQGLFANSEHFVILFAVAGLLLLLYALDKNNLLALLAASVSLGIAFLMKQHGAAFILFAGIYLLVSCIRRRTFEFKSLLLTGSVFIAGVMLPFGLMCLLLWRAGVFQKFWFWTVTYALRYVSMVPVLEGLEVLKNIMITIVDASVAIWFLAVVGLATSFISKKVRRHALFIVGFFLFSFVSTCPGFYFRPHYFILLLPAVALLAAVGLFGIVQALESRVTPFSKYMITVYLIIAAPLYTLYHQQNYLFEWSPEVVSRVSFASNHFPVYLKIAEYVKASTSKDDTIAILGSEPQILFYAGRCSATSYVYVYPLMEPQPYALQMQKEMINQIEAAEPLLLLFIKEPHSWAEWPDSHKLIFDWLDRYCRQHYRFTGIVEFVSEQEVVYRWDRDAENYQPQSSRGVVVYRRND